MPAFEGGYILERRTKAQLETFDTSILWSVQMLFQIVHGDTSGAACAVPPGDLLPHGLWPRCGPMTFLVRCCRRFLPELWMGLLGGFFHNSYV